MNERRESSHTARESAERFADGLTAPCRYQMYNLHDITASRSASAIPFNPTDFETLGIA